LIPERLNVIASQMLCDDSPGDDMSEVHEPSTARTGPAEVDQPWLTSRRTALLASALLLLVVVPLPWTAWAALLAVPVFVYGLVSLPAGRERTVALLSSGLAVLAPVVFLLIFA
jgi:hypothetical protein